MGVTIKDVAETANVSVGTVSRVLSGNPTVGEDTAERVKRAVEKLDYKPLRKHPAISAPLKGKNIALLLLGLDRSLAALPSVSDATHGVESALSEYGANLFLADLPHADHIPPFMDRNRIDGVIIKAALQGNLLETGNTALFNRLQSLPTVWYLGRPNGCSWGDVVQSNDLLVGQLAAEHLVSQGHKNLAILSPKPNQVTLKQRLTSFIWHAKLIGADISIFFSKNKEWNLPLRIVDNVSLVEGLVNDFLQTSSRPTAIFVPSDSIAAMLYKAFNKRGIKPGTDISLISCNNEQPILTGLYPTLTTIDIHAEQIGSRTVDQIAWRISHPGQANLDIMVEPDIVEGESVLKIEPEKQQ